MKAFALLPALLGPVPSLAAGASGADPFGNATELPGLSPYHVQEYQRRGLTDPERDIVRDLMERTDLLPHEGVLGGTMFFVEEATYVLTERWVLATYEDGHVQGHALFEYRVSETGEIEWRRLAASLQE